jgi:hypothetical protein
MRPAPAQDDVGGLDREVCAGADCYSDVRLLDIAGVQELPKASV